MPCNVSTFFNNMRLAFCRLTLSPRNIFVHDKVPKLKNYFEATMIFMTFFNFQIKSLLQNSFILCPYQHLGFQHLLSIFAAWCVSYQVRNNTHMVFSNNIAHIASILTNEPPHEKTNNLHMRKQRRRSASQ